MSETQENIYKVFNGEYELGAKLGSGSFGDIFLGYF